MVNDQFTTFRRYRAPEEDGRAFVDPPRTSLAAVVGDNRQRLRSVCYDLRGRCLSELSASARGGLVSAAVEYTRQYRDVPDALVDCGSQKVHGIKASPINPQSELQNPKLLPPLILSGHQPQLFHPGVWYKNFVLGDVALEVGGIGLHLSIDSDLCRSVAIRVPTGTIDRPHVETVAFDLAAPAVPYEERAIRDLATFSEFGRRVQQLIAPFVGDPLIEPLWPLVSDRALATSNVGLALAQGRHRLEGTWRNQTLELPQSAVCQLPEFSWFVVFMLAELPRFRAAHNNALATFRRAHRLRNRAQPVPDLAFSDDWLEAPLWMWTAEDPERRPLFARHRTDSLEITDRKSLRFELPLANDGNATSAVDGLLELARRGIKIRTRALATTLFARLVLSDLFLHGIGGAKYDQVTDLIAREFFGFDLPEFATVSATLRLPVERAPAAESIASACRRQLRELQFHPERFVDLEAADAMRGDEKERAADWIQTKRQWIATPKTPQNARERHLAIAAANEALQPFVENLRAQVEARCRARDEHEHRAAILDSREYAYCLYPRRQFDRLVKK